jgi:phage-related protein
MARRRWRHYATASGRRPVKEFLERLSDKDAAAVAAAMDEVRKEGLRSARHLQGQVYEVRAEGIGVTYRVLFAPQGKQSQVLLTLSGFRKKTQKTPSQIIRLAQRRLRDWERRGANQKNELAQQFEL